jgi:hypothetical protein
VKRILVDLRVYLATVVVLGVALALVGLAFAGVYNAPIEHRVYFQGDVTARVVNYSTIVTQQNFTELGIPSGAILGFGWYYGDIGAVAILAYAGPSPAGTNAVVCAEGPTTFGLCAWTANGQSYTVSISQAISAPALPLSSANYTSEVSVQGWYAYSTPAH